MKESLTRNDGLTRSQTAPAATRDHGVYEDANKLTADGLDGFSVNTGVPPPIPPTPTLPTPMPTPIPMRPHAAVICHTPLVHWPMQHAMRPQPAGRTCALLLFESIEPQEFWKVWAEAGGNVESYMKVRPHHLRYLVRLDDPFVFASAR